MTLEIQALTILNMIGAGICLGAAFDTYARLFWRKKKHWLGNLQDLLFWVVCGVLVFMWLRLINQGEMRTVIFLALLCGYAAYQALIQRTFTRVLEFIIRVIVTLYRWTRHVLYVVIYKPIYWLCSLLVALCLFIFNLLLRTVTLLTYPLLKIKKGFFGLMAKWFRKKDE